MSSAEKLRPGRKFGLRTLCRAILSHLPSTSACIFLQNATYIGRRLNEDDSGPPSACQIHTGGAHEKYAYWIFGSGCRRRCTVSRRGPSRDEVTVDRL